jgi:PHD/YefM family antitoxin component YafN of YafNO toxin-antitoxin module
LEQENEGLRLEKAYFWDQNPSISTEQLWSDPPNRLKGIYVLDITVRFGHRFKFLQQQTKKPIHWAIGTTMEFRTKSSSIKPLTVPRQSQAISKSIQVFLCVNAYLYMHLTYTLSRPIIKTISSAGVSDMERINALKLRNNLGEILDRLSTKGEPILISKGRKIRAVLVTPEDFEKRFLDVKAREEKERLLQLFKSLRKRKKESIQSLKVLRQLRGYEE